MQAAPQPGSGQDEAARVVRGGPLATGIAGGARPSTLHSFIQGSKGAALADYRSLRWRRSA